jgi:L-ribulose-5-phosphate 3-epimerase
MTFTLGYGTNGFRDHGLDDALEVIADLGYGAVALTLDHGHLDPYADDLAARTRAVAARLSRLNLRCVIETGARYLLDPYRKHRPTLVDADPSRRLDFLSRAMRIGAGLGAQCVSFWAGVLPEGASADTGWNRLRSTVDQLVAEADRREVQLALEPEPGMAIAHVDEALKLRAELGSPPALGITLDVGHCVAIEAEPAHEWIRRLGPLLVNVQLDDAVPGVHEHLEFGRGDLDLAAVLAALDEIGYAGSASVELPRHSHAGPAVARTSMAALVAAGGPR